MLGCWFGIHKPIIRFREVEYKEDGMSVPIDLVCSACPKKFSSSAFMVRVGGARIESPKASFIEEVNPN